MVVALSEQPLKLPLDKISRSTLFLQDVEPQGVPIFAHILKLVRIEP